MPSTDAPPIVPDAVLTDLRARLTNTRLVPLLPGRGWERGVDAVYLNDLVDYWAHTYDWRPHEQRIREMPWEGVTVAGQPYRVVHHRAGSDAPTVLLLHGWPDSVLRFERLLPLLADCNVVVPPLPGYPFAPPLTTGAMTTTKMGDVVVEIMEQLGYQRYTVSGGDVGAWVAHAAATAAPQAVSSLHLTEIPYEYLTAADPAGLTPTEHEAAERARRWRVAEGAYDDMQATKPRTLAVGLGDSPAGLLAWIVEKLHSWSECGGNVETVFPRADILTWTTAYWVTQTIGTSFTSYAGVPAPPEHVEAPTAVTVYPGDFLTTPESFGRRFFDIRTWDVMPRGGHFAAWEQPELFATGVRSAIALAAA